MCMLYLQAQILLMIFSHFGKLVLQKIVDVILWNINRVGSNNKQWNADIGLEVTNVGYCNL